MVDGRDEGDGSQAVHPHHRGSGASTAFEQSDGQDCEDGQADPEWDAVRCRRPCRRLCRLGCRAPTASVSAWAGAYAECLATGRSSLALTLAADGSISWTHASAWPTPRSDGGSSASAHADGAIHVPAAAANVRRGVVQFEIDKPITKVAGVPPEEMRLDRYARTWRDSRIVGHERVVPIDQMIAMGYDRETCLEYVQSQDDQRLHDGGPASQSRALHVDPRRRRREVRRVVHQGRSERRWATGASLHLHDGRGPRHRPDEEANRIKFAMFSCDPISTPSWATASRTTPKTSRRSKPT